MANEWRWAPFLYNDNNAGGFATYTIPRPVESPVIAGWGGMDFTDHKIPLRGGKITTGRSLKAPTITFSGRITFSSANGKRTETDCLAELILLATALRGTESSIATNKIQALGLFIQFDNPAPGGVTTGNVWHYRDLICDDLTYDVTNITRDGIPYAITLLAEDPTLYSGGLPA